MRDAIGLVGRLDEHFLYAADIVAEGVVGLGADDFCGVQHGCSFVVREAGSQAISTAPNGSRQLKIQRHRSDRTPLLWVRAKKKPGPAMVPATGAQKSPLVATGRASPPCPRIIPWSSEPIRAGKFPALAEPSRNARRGGDFRVPNWTAAPLRCAVVL